MLARPLWLFNAPLDTISWGVNALLVVVPLLLMDVIIPEPPLPSDVPLDTT